MVHYINRLLAYFTLEGRMPHGTFIRVCLVYSLLMLGLMALGLWDMESSGTFTQMMDKLAQGGDPAQALKTLEPSPFKQLVLLAAYFLLLPGIVRRLKDLGWNPFWGSTALYFHTCLVTLAALVGLDAGFTGDWVFSVVETLLLTLLTFLHGKTGTNAYGPDPLAPKKKLHEISVNSI